MVNLPLLLQQMQTVSDKTACMFSIANQLFFHHVLYSNGQTHRISIIEFYLDNDPFSHRHEQQQENSTWYVHKVKSKQQCSPHFMAPTRLGLDITTGNGKKKGGILLRGIDTKDGQHRTGPATILNHVLVQDNQSILENASLLIKKLRLIDGQNIFSCKQLCLKPSKPLTGKIYRGERIGLYAKGDPEKEKYAKLPLRFASWKTDKKQKSMKKVM